MAGSATGQVRALGAEEVAASVAAIAEVDAIRIAAETLPEQAAVSIVIEAACQRGLIDREMVGRR